MRNIFLLFVTTFLCLTGLNAQVDNYQVFISTCCEKATNRELLVLRKFQLNSKLKYLAVNANDLKSKIISANACSEPVVTTLDKFIAQNPLCVYSKLFKAAASTENSMRDAGITHNWTLQKGICLTIDLCPSLKRLDRELFIRIRSHFNENERPIPLAICVAGGWIKSHQADLDWLKKQVADSILDIDWVNHSYHHFVSDSLPINKNFMLRPSTNVENEILENEKLMISKGLVPSVFFRFPGLISNKKLFSKVLCYGLLPLGSDAWLAKNQNPKPGSIVLIHGNGNEPLGIKKFYELLDNNHKATMGESWMLYDLRSAE